MIRVRRVYEEPSTEDGKRILVDRLWPRGLKKEEAKVDLWLKEIAPSDELRKWFAHDPVKWGEFKKRYFAELKDKADPVKSIRREARDGDITLLFSAKDRERNNAVALKEYLEQVM